MLRKEPTNDTRAGKNTLWRDTREAQLNRKDKHAVNWKGIKSHLFGLQRQNPKQVRHPARTIFVGNKARVFSAREFNYRRGRLHLLMLLQRCFSYKVWT